MFLRFYASFLTLWTRNSVLFSPCDFYNVLFTFLVFLHHFYVQTPGKSSLKKRKKESKSEQDLSADNESVNQPGRAFVPFNYSDVDYSTFTGRNV